MAQPVRFGIVGCGVIAPIHAEAVTLNPEVAVLTACCDELEERASAFAAERPGVTAFSSLEAMLDSGTVDAVCICTPSGLHADAVEAAAQRGIHSLVEKPLDVNREGLDRIAEAARKANVKVASVFQRRTWQVANLVRDALKAGALGKLVVSEAHMHWHRSAAYYKSGPWRGRWDLDGGGALMNQGIHVLDLLIYLAGPVEAVSAMMATRTHEIEVEDTLTANLRFRDGSLASFLVTTSARKDEPIAVSLRGENGVIAMSDDRITAWDTEGFEPPDGWQTSEAERSAPLNVFAWGHKHLVRDLAEAIRDDRPPLIPPEEGRRAVDTAIAIYTSAREGREVKV
jgi:predicted dehydrogenase